MNFNFSRRSVVKLRIVLVSLSATASHLLTITAHPAPNRKGKQLKFLFATQAEVAPPTFVIFVNDRELVHFTYERFLENRIRAAYPFEGTPLRLVFRNREADVR